MEELVLLIMVIVIGFGSGFLTGVFYKPFAVQKEKIESDPEAMGIGTLYIYEGSDRDRYSFAFDCPLDQISKFKKVTLDIKKRQEKSVQDIENDLFAEDFGTNMSNF